MQERNIPTPGDVDPDEHLFLSPGSGSTTLVVPVHSEEYVADVILPAEDDEAVLVPGGFTTAVHPTPRLIIFKEATLTVGKYRHFITILLLEKKI